VLRYKKKLSLANGSVAIMRNYCRWCGIVSAWSIFPVLICSVLADTQNSAELVYSFFAVTHTLIFARDAMLTRVLAMALCLCLSVTSRCFVKTDERIELVFWRDRIAVSDILLRKVNVYAYKIGWYFFRRGWLHGETNVRKPGLENLGFNKCISL